MPRGRLAPTPSISAKSLAESRSRPCSEFAWMRGAARRLARLPFEGRLPCVAPTAFVAPSATLVGEVRVAAGASIWCARQPHEGSEDTTGHPRFSQTVSNTTKALKKTKTHFETLVHSG